MWAERAWLAERGGALPRSGGGGGGPWQRINHFPNHQQLTRKDLLARNLKRAAREAASSTSSSSSSSSSSAFLSLPGPFDLLPPTFLLPTEYRLFADAFRRGGGGTWIMKPVGRCQGQGISLVSRASQVERWAPDLSGGGGGGGGANDNDDDDDDDDRAQPASAAAGCAASADALRARYGASYCAQRYVESPYLVAGRKFDLRIYALVTAHHGGGGGGVSAAAPAASASAAASAPRLRVYLYRSGFARFAGQRYSMRIGDLADARVHLTNVAVQKKQHQQPGRAAADAESGHHQPHNPPPPAAPLPALKWPLRELRLHIAQRHGRPAADALFSAIQALVVRALLAVRGAVAADARCFELYGYDVLIDSALRPWLLEVNASPSLTASDADDRALKFAMLHDALDAVGVERAAFAASAAGGGAVGGGGRGSSSWQQQPSPPPPPRRVGGFDLVWDGGPVGGAADAVAVAAAAAGGDDAEDEAPARAGNAAPSLAPPRGGLDPRQALAATLGAASLLGCYNVRDEGMWRWGPRLQEQEEEEQEERVVAAVGR
jgi:hypothetical protein